MSDDLDNIHAQTSAILEKLYDQKGQPNELDEAFTQEYFKLILENVKLDHVEGDERAVAFGPHVANAKLSQQDKV